MTEVSTKKYLRLETRSYYMTKPSEGDGLKIRNAMGRPVHDHCET